MIFVIMYRIFNNFKEKCMNLKIKRLKMVISIDTLFKNLFLFSNFLNLSIHF